MRRQHLWNSTKILLAGFWWFTFIYLLLCLCFTERTFTMSKPGQKEKYTCSYLFNTFSHLHQHRESSFWQCGTSTMFHALWGFKERSKSQHILGLFWNITDSVMSSTGATLHIFMNHSCTSWQQEDLRLIILCLDQSYFRRQCECYFLADPI